MRAGIAYTCSTDLQVSTCRPFALLTAGSEGRGYADSQVEADPSSSQNRREALFATGWPPRKRFLRRKRQSQGG
ncbi:hypothetical protein SBA2_470041 [Acidobacteriia bacterium SbA2]|nr:hypothetical protein SBA2_470041 [Acidobacteriia bacterium SbA2]